MRSFRQICLLLVLTGAALGTPADAEAQQNPRTYNPFCQKLLVLEQLSGMTEGLTYSEQRMIKRTRLTRCTADAEPLTRLNLNNQRFQDLEWGNGEDILRISGTIRWPNGKDAFRGTSGDFLYPNGSRAFQRGWGWQYPDGTRINNSFGRWYTPDRETFNNYNEFLDWVCRGTYIERCESEEEWITSRYDTIRRAAVLRLAWHARER